MAETIIEWAMAILLSGAALFVVVLACFGLVGLFFFIMAAREHTKEQKK